MPRGPVNELHRAARADSIKRTRTLLSRGSIDINAETPDGWTPLMVSTLHGHSQIAHILLDQGADVSIKCDGGATALHAAAQEGHLSIARMLVSARAALDAADEASVTPLHMAALAGHSEMARTLVEAGANPNSRASDGATPLYVAAEAGHADVIRVLLRVNANPILTKTLASGRDSTLPIGMAAGNGHAEVVRVLLQQLGIEGCGGKSGGRQALELACMGMRPHNVDIMAMLMDAGVADNGTALRLAAGDGREAAVEILLLRQAGGPGGGEYVDSCGHSGESPLLRSITTCLPRSPRVVRRLVDAGADTASAVGANPSPLTLTTLRLREKKIHGKDATEEQLHRLEAIRRLLLQIDAVHAVSWLWQHQSGVPLVGRAAGGRGREKAASPSKMPLALTLPILRQRARRRGMLLTALFRYSKKVGSESARAA